MILLLDNYDSFVHNLARYLRLLGEDVRIERNDAMSVDDIRTLKPRAIVISPGPCGPTQAGICVDVVKELGPYIPIFGVCLGHQCINEAYGGTTVRAPQPIHGIASALTHSQSALFQDLPETFNVGRYHSLMCQLSDNSPLRVTATSDDGVIMAFSHDTHPVYGVQFHPESILTEHGSALLANFLKATA